MSRHLLLLSISLLLTSCETLSHLYLTPVGEGRNQVFVRPSGFRNPDMETVLDFTVRDLDREITSVVCNLSVSSAKRMPAIPSRLEFRGAEGVAVPLANPKVLFAEFERREVRISTTIAPDDFYRLIALTNVTFVVVEGGRTNLLSARPDFLRKLEAARNQFSYGRSVRP